MRTAASVAMLLLVVTAPPAGAIGIDLSQDVAPCHMVSPDVAPPRIGLNWWDKYPYPESEVYKWTSYYCEQFGVDPAFALAVANVESRGQGHEFRFGLLCGKWYGPYNIEKGYVKRWPDIITIKGNCKVGVRALRGKSILAVLKRYNGEFNSSYYRAIKERIIWYRRMISK